MHTFHPIAHRVFPILCVGLALAISGCADREERISQALGKAEEARQREENTQALSILGKAALKIPDSAALQEALGTTYLEGNDPQAAIVAYQKAIELDEARNRLWVNIADLNVRLGEDLAALSAFERYLESFPNDFLAWKNFAALQEKRGDLKAAIEANLQWNRIRPSAGPALKLGQLFGRMGNAPQARSWISQAAAYANDPGAKDALATLIELEINSQQYLPASTWLDQYEERYGSGSDDARIRKARDTIGRWKQAQQDIADAAAALEEQRKALQQQARDARLREEKAREEREALLAQQTQVETIEDNLPTDSGTVDLVTEDTTESESEGPIPTPLFEDETENLPNLDAIDYLESARDAVLRADTDHAIDLYWRALGPGVDNPLIWYELATVYQDRRNWIDAEACILEAKRRDPTSPSIASAYLSIIAQTQTPSRVIR